MPNILILAAHSRITRVGTEQLLKQTDAQLTLYLRNAKQFHISGYSDWVRTVEGDVLDTTTIARIMAGQDVVFANLARRLEEHARSTILDPYRNAATAIEASDLDYTMLRPPGVTIGTKSITVPRRRVKRSRMPRGRYLAKVADLVVKLALTPGLESRGSLGRPR